MDVRRLARDERADLAALLATLTAQQWEAPALCTHWRVRDVVAHVISYDNLGIRALIAVAARARFRPGRINDVALARYDRHTPEQLLALLAGNLQPRGQPAALGDRAGLVETLIHHQDIRRAIGEPRAWPGSLPAGADRPAQDSDGVARPAQWLSRRAAPGRVARADGVRQGSFRCGGALRSVLAPGGCRQVRGKD